MLLPQCRRDLRFPSGCDKQDVERLLYADIAPADLAPYWNLYVFRIDGASPGILDRREPGRTLADLGLKHPLIGT